MPYSQPQSWFKPQLACPSFMPLTTPLTPVTEIAVYHDRWDAVEGHRDRNGFDKETAGDDETLMSFIVVTIEPENRRLTARECLWNADRAPGIKWGATATIAY